MDKKIAECPIGMRITFKGGIVRSYIHPNSTKLDYAVEELRRSLTSKMVDGVCFLMLSQCGFVPGYSFGNVDAVGYGGFINVKEVLAIDFLEIHGDIENFEEEWLRD